jgi:hypothetical protein
MSGIDAEAMAKLMGQFDASAKLQEELRDADRVIGRQGDILTAVANALKGEPDELTMHDHSDLGRVARELVAQLERIRRELDQARFKAERGEA